MKKKQFILCFNSERLTNDRSPFKKLIVFNHEINREPQEF